MHSLKQIFKWLLGIAFVLAGANHFINSDFYLKMMPPYLPWHLFLVRLSGVLQIALGILLLIPKFSRLAAWGMIALLIAVFPANLFMAMNTDSFPEFSRGALYLRLPLQLVIIAWAYWFAHGEERLNE